MNLFEQINSILKNILMKMKELLIAIVFKKLKNFLVQITLIMQKMIIGVIAVPGMNKGFMYFLGLRMKKYKLMMF